MLKTTDRGNAHYQCGFNASLSGCMQTVLPKQLDEIFFPAVPHQRFYTPAISF